MVLINNTGSSARAWLPKVIGLWLMIACLLTSETVGSGCRVLYLRMMIFWPLHHTHNSSPANGGLNCAFFCAGFPLICGLLCSFVRAVTGTILVMGKQPFTVRRLKKLWADRWRKAGGASPFACLDLDAYFSSPQTLATGDCVL